MSLTAPALFRNLLDTDLFAVKELSTDYIDWLIKTGLGPIAHTGIKRSGTKIPAIDMEKLLAVSLSGRFESSNRAQGLNLILEQAGPDNGISLLKGILFAHNFYNEPHFRPMSDIDLLVTPEKLTTTVELLLDLGAEQKALEDAAYFDDHHHLMPFHMKDQDIWIEVHTGLFPPRSGLAGPGPFEPENIHKLTQATKFFDKPVLALNNEMQFFHTTVHWAEEFRRIGGIFGLIDFYLLMQKVQNELDWDWIFSRSDNRAHIAPAQLAISYLERAELISLPADIRSALKNRGKLCTSALKTLNTIIDQYLVLGKPPGALMSAANLLTSWKTALHSGNNMLYLAKTPWNVAFPEDEADRFTLNFQLERVRNARARLKKRH